MRGYRVAHCALAAALFSVEGGPAMGDLVATVADGQTVISIDADALSRLELSVHQSGSPSSGGGVSQLWLTPDAASTLNFTESDGILDGTFAGAVSHGGSFTLVGPGGQYTFDGFAFGQVQSDAAAFGIFSAADVVAGDAFLALSDSKLGFDRPGGVLMFEAPEMTISPGLAALLGDAGLAGQSIGSIAMRIQVDGDGLVVADEPEGDEGDLRGGNQGTVCGQPGGPDVIVGSLPDVANYASIGGIEAFAIGTTSCNIGDTVLLWEANINQHPVIGQSIFRLKNGRFEHVGQSWLKHGFLALTQNECGCGCQNPGNGQRLGIGCSDPYNAGLNGTQDGLGPKFEVNAFTGEYPYPATDISQTGNSIYKRVQVAITDLEDTTTTSTRYFAEGHYVTPDDSAANNQDNNASYRELRITGSGSTWSASFTGMPATQREQPAIRAWQDTDPTVEERDVRIPGEGLVIVAAKVTGPSGGFWTYEYAVQNLNSDRSIGSFRVPIDPTATVQNIGFHDVAYHSGEPFDGTDWPGVFENGGVSWKTVDYVTNPNANALRFSTLYNFRFQANVGPQPGGTEVRLGIFKPGTPVSVNAPMVGPSRGFEDCNGNGVDDAIDIAGSTSNDCDGSGVPDECEPFPAAELKAVRVANGLASPVYLTSPPGDLTRQFIVEQAGRIRIIKNGTLLATPFLNITGIVRSTGDEQGLLSVAFHPDYENNGFFYVCYTGNSGVGDTVVARYTVSGDPDVASPGSALIIDTVAQPQSNHNGGQLQFGPDGMLYLGLGDGGGAGDNHGPIGNAQNMLTKLGKMLRYDVDAGPPYIPGDNPFVGDPNALDLIWASGVRNPWRFSFDRNIGDMYMADVGQNAWEEINFQPSASPGGENYGWRCMEGNHCFNSPSGPQCTCFAPNLTDPIHEYARAGGACAVTGGYVYRGCAIPSLGGTYFYGDYCAGFVRSFRVENGLAVGHQDRTAELTPDQGLLDNITSFGEDAAGEIYIVTRHGDVFKIVPAVGAPECGNGIVESGEACDDGNTAPGDGCDSNCQIEVVPNDDCVDAIQLCPSGSQIVDALTAGATNDGSASCGNSATSPDTWFSYKPLTSGNMTVATCGSNYDSVLSIHTGCPGTAGNELACNDNGSCSPQSVIQNFPVTAGETYFIRVSGANGADGVVKFTIVGPTCDTGITDCDGNGTDDALDIAGGAPDVNSNGILDACEELCMTTPGDGDGDCDFDLRDYYAAQQCYTGDVGAGSPVYGAGCACFDMDDDGDVDDADMEALISSLNGPGNPAGGCVALTELADPIRGGRLYDQWWTINGTLTPSGDHPLYPPAGSVSGPDTFRCKECHGWDYKGVDGAYASGPNFTGIPGVFGSVLTGPQLHATIKLSNVANGHGFGTMGLTDEDTADLVAFLETLVVDTDDFIDGSDAFVGNAANGDSLYNNLPMPALSCVFCHASDGTGINFGTLEDPIYLGTVANDDPWKMLHKIRFGNPNAPSMPAVQEHGLTEQDAADIGKHAQTFPTE